MSDWGGLGDNWQVSRIDNLDELRGGPRRISYRSRKVGRWVRTEVRVVAKARLLPGTTRAIFRLEEVSVARVVRREDSEEAQRPIISRILGRVVKRASHGHQGS